MDNDKTVKLDDIIEYVDTEIKMLKAHGQSVACATLRRVKEFAEENAVTMPYCTLEETVSDGWISVEERLPENDGKYMVWYKGELDICEFNADSQTFGYTYDDYDEMYSHLVCWDDGMDKDVTHWQHLPKPPKGE